MLATLFLMAFPIAMAFAAANDLFTMRIPNRISLVLIGAFFASAVLTGMPIEKIGIHAGIALGVLTATFLLFSFNLLGGGDAKLMAAGALWMGPEQAVPFLAYVTVFGGILAMLILAYRKFPARMFALPNWAERLHIDGTGIPYGIAIAAGGLLVFPETELFRFLA